MRAKGSVALCITCVVVVLAPIGGCYGPTEVSLAVNTDGSCAKLETEIHVGNRSDPQFEDSINAAAVTNDCLATEPHIGTITVVPKASRKDQFDVEVITAPSGGVSDCVKNKFVGCIVARRRVSFQPHEALTLPILMSASCIGKPCFSNDGDQTCDRGTCRLVTDCTESGCPNEHDAGVPISVPDAGPDGAPEAAVPDAQPSSCPSIPTPVVDNEAILGFLAMDGADFLYVNAPSGGGTMGQVKRVPRSGGAAKTVQMALGLTGVATVPNTPGSYAFATTSTNSEMSISRVVGIQTTSGTPLGGYTSGQIVFSVFSGTSTVFGVALLSGGAHRSFGSQGGIVPGGSATGDIPEPLADEAGYCYGVGGGTTLLRFLLNATTAQPGSEMVTPFTSTLSPDIALAEGMLYASAKEAPMTGIYQIPVANIGAAPPPAWLPGVFATSLAIYGKTLYFIDETKKLFRVATSPPGKPEQIATLGPDAARLAVDSDCVYWLEDFSSSFKTIKRVAR